MKKSSIAIGLCVVFLGTLSVHGKCGAGKKVTPTSSPGIAPTSSPRITPTLSRRTTPLSSPGTTPLLRRSNAVSRHAVTTQKTPVKIGHSTFYQEAKETSPSLESFIQKKETKDNLFSERTSELLARLKSGSKVKLSDMRLLYERGIAKPALSLGKQTISPEHHETITKSQLLSKVISIVDSQVEGERLHKLNEIFRVPANETQLREVVIGKNGLIAESPLIKHHFNVGTLLKRVMKTGSIERGAEPNILLAEQTLSEIQEAQRRIGESGAGFDRGDFYHTVSKTLKGSILLENLEALRSAIPLKSLLTEPKERVQELATGMGIYFGSMFTAKQSPFPNPKLNILVTDYILGYRDSLKKELQEI